MMLTLRLLSTVLVLPISLSILVRILLNFFPTSPSHQSRCLSLTLRGYFSDARIDKLTYYPAGAHVEMHDLAYTVEADDLPGFCRVQLTVFTNNKTGNSARTEVWLPDEWNGRLLGLGQGGWAGGVSYREMAHMGINASFAAFSTNTGHDSTIRDGSWATDPEALIDFADRALHFSVLASKATVHAYYQTVGDLKSYWAGCSTGGRQGLASAQRYPEDFDGVLVGSPAHDMAHLHPWILHVSSLVTHHWISAEEWEVIHEEVMKQCDVLDGVIDGVLEDPRECRNEFNFGTLICDPGESDRRCFSPEQVEVMRAVYGNWTEDGELLFSPLELGSELLFSTGLLGSSPFQTPIEYYRYMVLNDSTWDYHDFNMSVLRLGVAKNPGDMDVTNPDMRPFQERGGKVLHYFGWSDHIIAPQNSIRWYDKVSDFVYQHTNVSMGDFYQLFPVPGMAHCSGGEGANAFGGPGQGPPLHRANPRYDILRALVEWVEDGRKVEDVIAARWHGGGDRMEVHFTRRLCVYPMKAVWDGVGDTRLAESYRCSGFTNRVRRPETT